MIMEKHITLSREELREKQWLDIMSTVPVTAALQLKSVWQKFVQSKGGKRNEA